MIHQKSLLPGVELIFLYICIENFKTLLVRNHWTDFNITRQKYFFDDNLSRLIDQLRFVKKKKKKKKKKAVGGGGGGGLISPMYLNRKLKNREVVGAGFIFPIHTYLYKNILVRNHSTSFCIIWHKCSFDDPLSRLFKPPYFVKKHSQQGVVSPYFPNISIWKILKTFSYETTGPISI